MLFSCQHWLSLLLYGWPFCCVCWCLFVLLLAVTAVNPNFTFLLIPPKIDIKSVEHCSCGIWTGPTKDVHKMAGDARCGNVKFGTAIPLNRFMSSLLVWDVMYHRLVVRYWCPGGQPVGFEVQGVQSAWPVQVRPIGCHEMSVSNYQYMLCNIPERWRSLLHCGRIQTSRINSFLSNQYLLTWWCHYSLCKFYCVWGCCCSSPPPHTPSPPPLYLSLSFLSFFSFSPLPEVRAWWGNDCLWMKLLCPLDNEKKNKLPTFIVHLVHVVCILFLITVSTFFFSSVNYRQKISLIQVFHFSCSYTVWNT